MRNYYLLLTFSNQNWPGQVFTVSKNPYFSFIYATTDTMSIMKTKKVISNYAGLPLQPSGIEENAIYLGVTAALIVLTLGTAVQTLITNSDLAFRNPLLPVTAFFIAKLLLNLEWEYVIFGAVKVLIAGMIVFLGMPVITNGFWWVWAVVAGLFLITGIVDLLASRYERHYTPQGYPE